MESINLGLTSHLRPWMTAIKSFKCTERDTDKATHILMPTNFPTRDTTVRCRLKTPISMITRAWLNEIATSRLTHTKKRARHLRRITPTLSTMRTHFLQAIPNMVAIWPPGGSWISMTNHTLRVMVESRTIQTSNLTLIWLRKLTLAWMVVIFLNQIIYFLRHRSSLETTKLLIRLKITSSKSRLLR